MSLEAKLRVTLFSVTPNPELTVAVAAERCFSPQYFPQLVEQFPPDRAADQAAQLAGEEHRALEHVSLTFALAGVSRAATVVLLNYSPGGFHETCQRNVRMEPEFVIPPLIAGDLEARVRFIAGMLDTFTLYESLRTQLLMDYAHERTDVQEETKLAMPGASANKVIVTWNALVLRRLIREQASVGEWELRRLARVLWLVARERIPALFDHIDDDLEMDESEADVLAAFVAR